MIGGARFPTDTTIKRSSWYSPAYQRGWVVKRAEPGSVAVPRLGASFGLTMLIAR